MGSKYINMGTGPKETQKTEPTIMMRIIGNLIKKQKNLEKRSIDG
jgi:hypothetical protein